MMLTKAKRKKKYLKLLSNWHFRDLKLLILKQRGYYLLCLGGCSKICIFNKIESHFHASQVILFHEYNFYVCIFSI